MATNSVTETSASLLVIPTVNAVLSEAKKPTVAKVAETAMHPLNYYIEALEAGNEFDIIVNLFDLHKVDHTNFSKVKRELLERLHIDGASPKLVRLALICFILAKLPTLDDVVESYKTFVPFTNQSTSYFNDFCANYPDAQSCKIYDL